MTERIPHIYSYTSAGNTGRPVHPMCAAMSSASLVGLFVARPSDGIAVDRNGVALKAGQMVKVHQEEGTRTGIVVDTFPLNKTCTATGCWVDVNIEGRGPEGIPSYILEVIDATATPSAAVGADGPVADGKQLQLEYGKRYLRRDGKVSGALEHTNSNSVGYSVSHPFWDAVHCLSYRADGGYNVSEVEDKFDLIAEYHEPEPSTPAESPDDWVTQDRVPARVALDEYRVSGSQSEPGVWKRCIYGTFPIVHGYQHGRPLITGTGNSTLELRCRRRDLPVVPIKAPVTKLSSSVDVNRPENTKTRTVTLREYEEVGAHSVWSTSVSEYSFTGRTTVVEVPE